MEKYVEKTPADNCLDTDFAPYDNSKPSPTSMFFGHQFLTHKLYQLSPVQDLELAKLLVRRGSLFVENLSDAENFTEEGYGNVTRVYIICDEDQAIHKDFQRWMVENYPVKHVMEINGSDHMPMFCKPKELCDCLCEIADKFA